MKTIKRILFVVLLTITITSCTDLTLEDTLEQNPIENIESTDASAIDTGGGSENTNGNGVGKGD